MKTTNRKFKVKCCEQTCFANPCRWYIRTIENHYIYARYWWGYLTLTLNVFNSMSEPIYCEMIGDESDGVLSTSELIEHTKSILDWNDFYD